MGNFWGRFTGAAPTFTEDDEREITRIQRQYGQLDNPYAVDPDLMSIPPGSRIARLRAEARRRYEGQLVGVI